MAVNNEKEFKAALAALPLARQRQVGALLVQRVLDLCHDARVKLALGAATQTGISDEELVVVAQLARTARIESYTQCGRDTGWTPQAGHFVAAGAECCVRAATEGEQVAWEAAMQARLARTCHDLAQGDGSDTDEASAQYQALQTYLNA